MDLCILTCLSLLLSLTFATPLPASEAISPSDGILSQTVHCTNEDKFFSPRFPFFTPSDCTGAIKLFIDSAAWPEGTTRYEFLPPDPSVPGKSTVPKRRTPQKWSFGRCSVVLATLSCFDPGEILGIIPPPSGTDQTDVSTYEAVSHAVEDAAHKCLPSPRNDLAANATDAVFGDKGPANVTAAIVPPLWATEKKGKRAERGSGGGGEGPLGFVDWSGYTILGQQNNLVVLLWAPGSPLDLRHPAVPR